jgi:hypothetical protein
MLDLKGPLDAVQAADAALKSKAAEISALMLQGTPEATQQALALQETLDSLQADYDAKKGLYDKLVALNSPSNVANLFVPTSSTPSDQSLADASKNVMTLAEYNALPPRDRLAFAKRKGSKLQ